MTETGMQKLTAHAVARERDCKALAILETIKHFVDFPLKETKWLDIGCGNGGIAVTIAPYVKVITGIDPEPWVEWEDFLGKCDNLNFICGITNRSTIADESADIILCNQVYEHVYDVEYLISEVYRILRPGGYCYFAGPNLLFPVEPHVFLPFVHWLPRKFAIDLLRICGSKGILDAKSTHYWKLKEMLFRFEIINAVPFIVKNPDLYGKTSWMKPFWLWKFLGLIPSSFINAMTWISPGFVFILKKNF